MILNEKINDMDDVFGAKKNTEKETVKPVTQNTSKAEKSFDPSKVDMVNFDISKYTPSQLAEIKTYQDTRKAVASYAKDYNKKPVKPQEDIGAYKVVSFREYVDSQKEYFERVINSEKETDKADLEDILKKYPTLVKLSKDGNRNLESTRKAVVSWLFNNYIKSNVVDCTITEAQLLKLGYSVGTTKDEKNIELDPSKNGFLKASVMIGNVRYLVTPYDFVSGNVKATQMTKDHLQYLKNQLVSIIDTKRKAETPINDTPGRY